MSQVSVEEMRQRLLRKFQAAKPAGSDRGKGRYPIGLTDWDEAIDAIEDNPKVPVCLIDLGEAGPAGDI